MIGDYWQGHSFEEIAKEEIERRVQEGQITATQAREPAEVKRAQNAVHAWHSRAMRWIQTRTERAWRTLLD